MGGPTYQSKFQVGQFDSMLVGGKAGKNEGAGLWKAQVRTGDHLSPIVCSNVAMASGAGQSLNLLANRASSY